MGGGYIVIGAKEKDGRLMQPIDGLDPNSIDRIQKEILRCCEFLKPTYIPQIEPMKYEGKMLLLVWCPGGYERPYLCPKDVNSKNSQRVYYIRKLASIIEATDLDIKELMMLANNILFDDRINPNSEITDLKYPIIVNYLGNVKSRLLNQIDNFDVKQVASNLELLVDLPNTINRSMLGYYFLMTIPKDFSVHSD